MSRPKLGEYIRENELFAKKSLGQHFLLDINLTSKIAGLLQIDDDDVIFEIGPGPGGLTQALLNTKAKKIIAFEKDERFVEHLKTYFSDDLGRLEVISGDALKISPAQYLRDNGIECKSAKIIANLPYNVGTQLFLNWVTGEEKDWEMALMFQMEVAKRICAQTGDNHYGRLAILTQAVCHAHVGMHVPRLAFSPPPKVESAVAVITPKKKNRYDDLETLGKVTQAAFSQRRKMLRSSLAPLGDAEALCEAAGVKPTLRPEQLSPEGFYALCEVLKK